jgi:hypothetical protein
MNSLRKAVAVAAVSLLSLAGCGGGGGGGSSASNETSISIATPSVSATAGYGDSAPTRTVRVTATNVPADGLYIGLDATGEAVSFVDFNPISETQVDLVVQFRQPVEAGWNGDFLDQDGGLLRRAVHTAGPGKPGQCDGQLLGHESEHRRTGDSIGIRHRVHAGHDAAAGNCDGQRWFGRQAGRLIVAARRQ